MSIPNTQTIIEGKKSNFTVEQLKNASSKERPFYYPYRPDYSVTSNRVYEKPRHGENILSNSYKPPKLIIYNSGELGDLNLQQFLRMADDIIKNYYGYSSDEYEVFSLGNQDWLVKFHDDGTETFIIKEGNQNFKTSTENISAYPFIRDDGLEMLCTYRHSFDTYLPLPGRNYYVFKISLENKIKELYNLSMVPFTPEINSPVTFEYREKESQTFDGVKILGGKKLSVGYKPSSFRNLPEVIIQRVSKKAHSVTKTFTYEDDQLTNFDINSYLQNFEVLYTKKTLESGSKLDTKNIPSIENIIDDDVKDENFIVSTFENLIIRTPGVIRPDVKLIHVPKFFKDSKGRIYYRDIDKYYYYYFFGRLCRTEISYNNRESGRKIPARLQYADRNTYTWRDQTIGNFKKKEIHKKIADKETFRIRTKQLFLPHNNFYEPLSLDYDDPKFQEIQEATPRRNPYYIVEPFAEEFTFYSSKPPRREEVDTGEFDLFNTVLQFIREELVGEAFDTILASSLLAQFAGILEVVNAVIGIKTALFPEKENIFTRFPIISTIFPSFNFEIEEQKGNSSMVKINRSGTKGYTLSWDRADVINNGTDFLSKFINNFYEGLDLYVSYLFSEMGININTFKNKVKDNFHDNLIGEYLDLEEGNEIQKINIDFRERREPISGINDQDYYISYEPAEKKSVTVTCFFESLEEEYNFVNYVEDDSYRFENQVIVKESFFYPGGKVFEEKIDHNSLFLGNETISDILNIAPNENFFSLIPGRKAPKVKRIFPLASNKSQRDPEKFVACFTKNEINLSALIGIPEKFFKLNNVPIFKGIVPKGVFPLVYKKTKYILQDNAPASFLPDAFASIKVRDRDLKTEGTLYNLRSLLSENDEIEDQIAEYSYFYRPFTSSNLIKSPSYRVDRITAGYSRNIPLEDAAIIYLHTLKNYDGYEKGYLFAYFYGETRIRKFLYYMRSNPSNSSQEQAVYRIKFFEQFYLSSTKFLNTERSDPELYNFTDFDFPDQYVPGGAIFKYPNVLTNRTNEVWIPSMQFSMQIFKEEPNINLNGQPLGTKIVKSANLQDSNFYGKIEIPDTKTFFEKIAPSFPKFHAPREIYMFMNANLRINYRRLGEYYIVKNNLNIIFHAKQKILTSENKVNMRKVQNSPFMPNKTYVIYEGNVKKDLHIDEDGCITLEADVYSFVYDFVRYDFEKVNPFSITGNQVLKAFNPFQELVESININLQGGLDNGTYKIYEIASGTSKYEYEFKEDEIIYLNTFLFPFSSGGNLYELNHVVPIPTITENNTNYDFGWQYTREIKSKYYTNSLLPYYFSTVTNKYVLTTPESSIDIDEFPIVYKFQNSIIQANFIGEDRSVEIRYNPKEKFIPFVYAKGENVIVTNLNLEKLKPEQIYLRKSDYSDYPLIDTARVKFFSYEGTEFKIIEDSSFIPLEIETYDLVFSNNFPSKDNSLEVYMNNSWILINPVNISNANFIYERVKFNFSLLPNPNFTKEIILKSKGFYNLSTRSIINIYINNQPRIVFSNKYFDDFPFVHGGVKYLNDSTQNNFYVTDVILNSNLILIPQIQQVFERNKFPLLIDDKKYHLKNNIADTIFVPYFPNENHGEEYTAFSRYLSIPEKNPTNITEISKITSIAVYSIMDGIEKNISLLSSAQFINIFEFPFIYNGKYFYMTVNDHESEIVLKSFSNSIDPGVNYYYMYEFGFFRRKAPGVMVNHSYFPIYHRGVKYSVDTTRDIVQAKGYENQEYVYLDGLSNINFTGSYSYYEEGELKNRFIKIFYGDVLKTNFVDGKFIYGDKKYLLTEMDHYDQKKHCLRTKINGTDYCYVDFKNKASRLYNKDNGILKVERTNRDGGYLAISLFPFFCNGILYTLSDEYETAVECYIPSRSDVSLISFKLEPQGEIALSLLRESSQAGYMNHNNYGLMHKGQFPFFYKGVKYMFKDVELNENILIVTDDSTEIRLPDFGSGEKILVIKPYPNDIAPPILGPTDLASPTGDSISSGYRFHYYNNSEGDRARTARENISGGVIKEISNPPRVDDFPFYYNNKYYFLGEKDISNTSGKTVLYAYHLEQNNTLVTLGAINYQNLPLIQGNRFYHKGPNNFFTNCKIEERGEMKSLGDNYYVRNAVVGRNAARIYASKSINNFTGLINSSNVRTIFQPREFKIDGGDYFIYPGDIPDDFVTLSPNSNIRSMGYYIPNSNSFTNRNLLKSDIKVSSLNPMNKSFTCEYNNQEYVCQIREEVEPTTTIYYDRTRIIESVNNFTEELKTKYGSVPGNRGGSDDSVYHDGYFYKEKRFLPNVTPHISSLPETNVKILNYFWNQTSVYIEELSELEMIGDIYAKGGWVSINYFPFKYHGITYKLRLVSAEIRLIKIVSDTKIYLGEQPSDQISSISSSNLPGFKETGMKSIRNICNVNFYSAHTETGEKVYFSRKRTIDNVEITSTSVEINSIIYSSSGNQLLVNGNPQVISDDGIVNGLKFRNKYLSIDGVDYPIDSFPIIIGSTVKYQYDLSFVHTPRCAIIGNETWTDFKLTRTTDYFEEFITKDGTYYRERICNLGDSLTPNIPIFSERKKIIPLLKYQNYEIPLSRYGFVYEISGTRTSSPMVLFSFGDIRIYKEGTKIYKHGNSNTNFIETEIYFINSGEEIYMDGFEKKLASDFPLVVNGKKINQIKIPVTLSFNTFNFRDTNLSNMIYKTPERCHFIHNGEVYEYLINQNPFYANTSPLYDDGNYIIPASFSGQRNLLGSTEVNLGNQIIKGGTLYTRINNREIVHINNKTTGVNFLTGHEIDEKFNQIQNSTIPLVDKIFYDQPGDKIYTFEMGEITGIERPVFVEMTLTNFLNHIGYQNGSLIQVDGILYKGSSQIPTLSFLETSVVYNGVEFIPSKITKVADISIPRDLTGYIDAENLYSVNLINTKLTQTQNWDEEKFVLDNFVITITNEIFEPVTSRVIEGKKDIELVDLGMYIIDQGKLKISERFYTIGDSDLIDVSKQKVYSFERIEETFFAYEKIESYYSEDEFVGKTVYFLDGLSGEYISGKPFVYNKILYSGFVTRPDTSTNLIKYLSYGNQIKFVSIPTDYDRIVIFSINKGKDYEVNSNYIPSEYVPFIYNGKEYRFKPNFYTRDETIIVLRNEIMQEVDLGINGEIYEQNSHLVSVVNGKIPVSKFPFIHEGKLYEFEKINSSFFTYVNRMDLRIREGANPRNFLPDVEYYYKDNQRYELSGTLIFPMIVNNTLYTLTETNQGKFDFTRTEEIHYRTGTKWIDLDFSLIYQNDQEIQINNGFSPNGTTEESFVSEGIEYKLIPYTEDIVNRTKIIKSNFVSGINVGITGGIQLSTGFKKFMDQTVDKDLFPFIFNKTQYLLEPLLISGEKTIHGIDTVAISKSDTEVEIFFEDGTTALTRLNSINENLFPFIYSGIRYVLSDEEPPYNKIDIIQVSYTDNSAIELDIIESHVYSKSGWIPKAITYAQDLFPIISFGTKFTLAKLLPVDTIIYTKTVYVVRNSQSVETDIEETEIETNNGKIQIVEGIVDRSEFPFVWKNTQYQLVEVYDSNYVIKENREIDYFYSETSVSLGTGQIRVYYGSNFSKILDSSNIPISEFPFIYNNISYSVKANENKTREGLEIKTEKLETNRYEYVDYKTIENLTLVIRNNTKFFRIADIYKPAKIITDEEIRIIFL